jgi:serine protease Do
MKIKIRHIIQKGIVFVFLCLLVTSSNTFAGLDTNTKIYPLPMSELIDILEHWFARSDFEVHHRRTTPGNTLLVAEHRLATWRVSLKRHSPLATRITGDYRLNGKPDQAMLNTLWGFLDGYFKFPGTTAKKSSQTIPSVVLGRIDAVVCISGQNGGHDSQFSGFLIDPEGLILCTAHGLDTEKMVTVTYYDGRVQEGWPLKIDTTKDLALIKVNIHQVPFIPFKNGRELLGMGERLFAVGCPENLRGTVSTGIINAPPRRVGDLPLWQVNMEIYPGSSGSPVFDNRGNLAGMVKGRYRGTDSVGFLIPLGTIFSFLNGN